MFRQFSAVIGLCGVSPVTAQFSIIEEPKTLEVNHWPATRNDTVKGIALYNPWSNLCFHYDACSSFTLLGLDSIFLSNGQRVIVNYVWVIPSTGRTSCWVQFYCYLNGAIQRCGGMSLKSEPKKKRWVRQKKKKYY